MNSNIGHIIRITGLVIEMLGVWAVYRSNGAPDQTGFTLPGGKFVPWTWVPVVVGFVLWLVGTLIITATRRRRNTDRQL